MDYRMLLRKYIAHVGETEGVSFISSDPYDMAEYFTADEIRELNHLQKQTSELFWTGDGFDFEEKWEHRPRPSLATTTQCDWVDQDGYCCLQQRGHDGEHSRTRG